MSSLVNSYFDEVYCINQLKAKERWNSVSKRFIEENIFVKRIEATTPNDIFVLDCYNNEPNQYKVPWKDENYNIRTMAAYWSHLNCIGNALNSGHKKILVTEDDIIFNKNFNSMFMESILNIPDDWDIWLLGGFQYNWDHTVKIIDKSGSSNLFYQSDCTLGMFAYAISESGMEKFNEILHNYKYSNICIDSVLGWIIMKEKLLNVYVSYPMLIGHDTIKSITQNKTIDFTDRFPKKDFKYNS